MGRRRDRLARSLGPIFESSGIVGGYTASTFLWKSASMRSGLLKVRESKIAPPSMHDRSGALPAV